MCLHITTFSPYIPMIPVQAPFCYPLVLMTPVVATKCKVKMWLRPTWPSLKSIIVAWK